VSPLQNDQTNPGGEATMDVQLIMGVASNVSAYFWSTAGSQPHGPSAGEPFLAFWTALVNAQAVPLVVSTSYGDDEFDLDLDYLNHVNAMFQAAALRGVSILFASGDGGVAGGHGIANCTTFVAVFPGASPYITSVGGTQFNASSYTESGAPFSSGGFSNYWPMPGYQNATVAGYLNQPGLLLPPTSLYNANGRAFPDVSAVRKTFDVNCCLLHDLELIVFVVFFRCSDEQ
jgi:tripeptidyl-peptidase-1